MVKQSKLALVLVLTAVACQRIDRVEIAPKSVLLTTTGQTASVSATAFNAEGKGMEGVKFAFTSSAPGVATVDATGAIAAVKSGEAEITAKVGEKSSAIKVEVKIPAKVTLAAPARLVGLGATAELDAKVLDQLDRPIEGAAVTFALADTSFALVAGSTITAVAPGQTRLVASFGAFKAEADVVVELPAFAAITIEPATSTIKIGEGSSLITTVKNAEGGAVAGVPVTFASSDAKIATIDASGRVTGVAAGKAKITATAGDKSTEVEVVIKK